MSTHLQALNLALEHHKRNDLARAEAMYREVLAGSPDQADALGMLGQLLVQTRRANEGIALLREAIAARPREAAFQAALGQAMAETGDMAGAVEAQRRAVELVPAAPSLHYNLGISLKACGRLDEAVASFQAAIRLQPSFAQAHNNLGNALQSLGRNDEAVTAYRTAVRLAPGDAIARNNLGNALRARGEIEDAENSFREALRLQPRMIEAWNNLADVCHLTGRHDEAMSCIRRARELAPGNPTIHSNHINMLMYHPKSGVSALRDELARWSLQFAEPLKTSWPVHANDRSPGRKLRIGYVSPDFREHVVGRNILPLFQSHDRSRFEIHCYSGATREDAFTAKFRTLSDQFTTTAGMEHEALAECVQKAAIDILVDLSLHLENRLLAFARKPAPVQVTFAGYPGSTGLDAIDYRLTDAFLDPPGIDDSIYREASIRLPTFWCYDPGEDAPGVGNLPAASASGVTFGCLSNFCKVNQPTLLRWAGVLNAVAGSRLLLLSDPGPHQAQVRYFMLLQGVTPDRIQFARKCPRREYLSLYHRIDISLDTLPYNGHTTSLDALYLGVPVVTLAGDTVVGRGGVSQLSNLGLTELIARSPDDFVRIAVALANDLPRLAAMRASLRGRMERSVLMDAKRFASEIEQAYREMWRKWCASQA